MDSDTISKLLMSEVSRIVGHQPMLENCLVVSGEKDYALELESE